MRATMMCLVMVAACGAKERIETVPLDPDLPANGTSDVRASTAATAPAPLTATSLLDEAQIRAVTGSQVTFSKGFFAEEDPAAGVTTRYYDAMDESAWLDVGLRLWQYPTSDRVAAQIDTLAAQFKELQRTSPTSFVAREQGIRVVVFADPSRKLVAMLTCGVDQCTAADMSVRIADSVARKIEALWP